jgi:hypothetical protein
MSSESRLAIAQGFGAGLQNLAQGYVQAREKQAQQQQMEMDFANFDKYSPIQQATITAKYAGQPAAAAFLKNAGQRKAYQDFFGGGENILPGQTTAPNVSQLQNAMQVAAVGDQMQAPSPMNAMRAAQAIPQPATPQAPGINPVAQMSDEKLRQGILQFPELEKGFKAELEGREAERNRAQKAEKFQQDVFQKDRDWNTKVSEDFRKYITGIKRSLPATEAALNLSRNSIESGELGPWSANNLAAILGRPELLTASGAALNLAAKENLLGNLARGSGRAHNTWLEQVAIGAFPRAGQSLAANLTVQEGIEADLALRKAQSDAYDLISEQDMKKQGYEGADIEKRVNAAVQPMEDEILKRTAYRTRSIYEGEKGPKELAKMINKKPPSGTPLTRGMFQVFFNKTDKNLDLRARSSQAIKKAKQLGYIIYPDAKVQEYIQ